jgi:hypothetical protein
MKGEVNEKRRNGAHLQKRSPIKAQNGHDSRKKRNGKPIKQHKNVYQNHPKTLIPCDKDIKFLDITIIG